MVMSVASIFTSGGYNQVDIKEFVEFVQFYEKEYATSEEFGNAILNFKLNKQKIESHDSNETGYSVGVNQFTDMSVDEFDSWKTGGYVSSLSLSASKCSMFKSSDSSELPESVDWRESGAVTPVKNQGQCGSCWSFSATGAIEGAWAIKTDELISVSEQQLVDCSTSYGNNGCGGGLMDSAFEYVIDKGGLCSEVDIPYTATDESCEACDAPVVKVTGCYDVEPDNQVALKEAVSIGPVSIAIQADASIFQMYKSGVIKSSRCGTSLDHGVLVVGYGTEDGTMYWLVKNSWGETWGLDGYVKIERSDDSNDKGICGIAMQPSFPVC